VSQEASRIGHVCHARPGLLTLPTQVILARPSALHQSDDGRGVDFQTRHGARAIGVVKMTRPGDADSILLPLLYASAVHFGKVVDQGRVQVVERQGKVRVHGSPQRWRSGVCRGADVGRCPSMSEEVLGASALGEKDPARHRECPMGGS